MASLIVCTSATSLLLTVECQWMVTWTKLAWVAPLVLLVLPPAMTFAAAPRPQWRELEQPADHAPAANGVLRLVEAGPKALLFYMEINCKRDCPERALWNYKREEDSRWMQLKKSTTIENGVSHSSVRLQNLNVSTRYLVHVQEPEGTSHGYSNENWNSNRRSGFTANASVLTCPEDVPAVKHLMIFSMYSSWVGLSWIPPELQCKTRLAYRISFHSPGEETFEFLPKGVFWSNRLSLTGSIDGEVKHCIAWPNRHCLLVNTKHFTINRPYIVEVAVKRVVDNLNSRHVNTSFEFTSHQMAPEPPLELRCARAEPRALELRWRCPLRPGGRLLSAHVLASGAGGGDHVVLEQKIGMSELYALRVDGLRPASQYKVSVWLETEAGVKGKAASLLLWTTAVGHFIEEECPSRMLPQRVAAPGTGAVRIAGAVGPETAGGGNTRNSFGWFASVSGQGGSSDGVSVGSAQGNRRAEWKDNDAGGPSAGILGGSIAGTDNKQRIDRSGRAVGVGTVDELDGQNGGSYGSLQGERVGGNDGGGGSSIVSLSWWSWLPGVCIFFLFFITLLIVAAFRRRKVYGPSNISSGISIFNAEDERGGRAMVRNGEVFLETFLRPPSVCVTDCDYESIRSECPRNLLAHRMLPCISTFSMSMGPSADQQRPSVRGPAPAVAYVNSNTMELRVPLVASMRGRAENHYLPMDGRRCNSTASSSYIVPEHPGPQPLPRVLEVSDGCF